MSVTQKEIVQALRAASDRTDIFSGYYNSTHFAKLADYIEQDGIAPPDGYVLVPIKPTDVMCKAGFMAIPEQESMHCDTQAELARAQYRPVWKAMLSAVKEKE